MDAGQLYTEHVLQQLKRKYAAVYSQAMDEIEEKTKDYIARHEVRVQKQLAKLKAGKITKEDYEAWMRGQVFQRRQWEAKAESIADAMTHADENIMRMINGARIDVFEKNANWLSYMIEHGEGYDFGFGLYDEDTITRLLMYEPDLLPPKLVKYKANKAWYQKQIRNCVTQGIIQGEGLDEIIKRIMRDAKESSESNARRNARTAMTGAQNAGRVETMRQAERLGIKVLKHWMATLDMKTRDTHQELDGQEVEPDDVFTVDGHEIRFPGDPHAWPELVQNCRCTLTYSHPKYRSSIPRVDNIDGEIVGDMTYKQWFNAKWKDKTDTGTTQTKIKGLE